MNVSSQIFAIIYKTVNEEKVPIDITTLCEIAGVSRSGYYAWVKAKKAREIAEENDRKAFELILSAFKLHGYQKGARGIQMVLLHQNPPVIMNIKKIRRLMRKYRLFCAIRKPNDYKRMMRAIEAGKVADNLLKREFECYGPRMVLLTDITYIPYNGTFAYLSTILDAYTKEILAYVISETMEEDFVLKTINILIKDHGIDIHHETIFHSDQGSHYKSIKLIQILASKKIRQSMSRKGNCWDNAPQESFFGHMKDHIRQDLKNAKDFQEVKKIIDDYMYYYNNYRYQWDLAKLSPKEYYTFCTTGVYPIDIPNPPQRPVAEKKPEELGAKL